MKTYKSSFGENTTIGDILFLLLASFVLLFMLASFDTQKSQEKNLPDVQLSNIFELPSGQARHSSIAVTIAWEEKEPKIIIDEKEVSYENFELELDKLHGIGRVSLRSDERVPVGVQNKVIAACQRTGIENVALVVKVEQE